MNFQLAGTYIRVRVFKYNEKKLREYREKKKREQSIYMYSILTLEENREERKKWLESERAWDLRLMGDGIATKTSLTAPVICIVIIYARSRAFSFTTNSLRQTLFSDTLFLFAFSFWFILFL